MNHIYDPVQLKRAKLRDRPQHAAWIATVTEAASELENLLVDVPAEERKLPDYRTAWPWDFDPLAVALSIMTQTRVVAEQSLEALLPPEWGRIQRTGRCCA